MENEKHYTRALELEAIDAVESILDETERRYPDEENTMTVGLMLIYSIAGALIEGLGEELFYRNMRDIPDTKEAFTGLLDEISEKLNLNGYSINFDCIKKRLTEEGE